MCETTKRALPEATAKRCEERGESISSRILLMELIQALNPQREGWGGDFAQYIFLGCFFLKKNKNSVRVRN